MLEGLGASSDLQEEDDREFSVKLVVRNIPRSSYVPSQLLQQVECTAGLVDFNFSLWRKGVAYLQFASAAQARQALTYLSPILSRSGMQIEVSYGLHLPSSSHRDLSIRVHQDYMSLYDELKQQESAQAASAQHLSNKLQVVGDMIHRLVLHTFAPPPSYVQYSPSQNHQSNQCQVEQSDKSTQTISLPYLFA